MQSGIRQSVEFTSQDTALLKGDWKLESTCEVALVATFSRPTISKIPSDFSRLHLDAARNSRSLQRKIARNHGARIELL